MKVNFKSIFGIKAFSSDNSKLVKEELESDNVNYYYTNIVNSIILYTYDTKELEKMTPILIDPLTELFEELEQAFTPVCFETVFRLKLIENTFKAELLKFKQEVDDIPTEIWDWEFIDDHESWKKIRNHANELLNKIGVTSRIYNDRYTTIFDSEGNIIRKGENYN